MKDQDARVKENKQIIAGIENLPASWNVLYQKGNRADGSRGRFAGLYSAKEAENLVPIRDLAFEKLIMEEEDGNAVPVNLNLHQPMDEDEGADAFDEDELVGTFDDDERV